MLEARVLAGVPTARTRLESGGDGDIFNLKWYHSLLVGGLCHGEAAH